MERPNFGGSIESDSRRIERQADKAHEYLKEYRNSVKDEKIVPAYGQIKGFLKMKYGNENMDKGTMVVLKDILTDKMKEAKEINDDEPEPFGQEKSSNKKRR